MEARLDGLVDSIIESPALATTKAHVGDGALVCSLASSSKLFGSSIGLLLGGCRSPNNAANNIAHASRAIATEHLDSNDVGGLGNTVLARRDGTRAVSTMAIAILVNIVLGDGLTPACTALEFDVLNVDTGVNDVDIDTLATLWVVNVLGESSETKLRTVACPCETL